VRVPPQILAASRAGHVHEVAVAGCISLVHLARVEDFHELLETVRRILVGAHSPFDGSSVLRGEFLGHHRPQDLKKQRGINVLLLDVSLGTRKLHGAVVPGPAAGANQTGVLRLCSWSVGATPGKAYAAQALGMV
jgi:hypothetical protein